MVNFFSWVYVALATLIILAGIVIALASVKHSGAGKAHKSILFKAVAAHALGLPIAGIFYQGKFTLSCAQEGVYGIFQFIAYPFMYALAGWVVWKVLKFMIFGK